MNFINMMLISMSISTILLMLLTFLSKESNEMKESSANFECGFQSQSSKNNQMSGQFFMIAILFLIFDVEIAFMIPIPLSESSNMLINWNIILILVTLMAGTALEWKMGMIEWAK